MITLHRNQTKTKTKSKQIKTHSNNKCKCARGDCTTSSFSSLCSPCSLCLFVRFCFHSPLICRPFRLLFLSLFFMNPHIAGPRREEEKQFLHWWERRRLYLLVVVAVVVNIRAKRIHIIRRQHTWTVINIHQKKIL